MERRSSLQITCSAPTRYALAYIPPPEAKLADSLGVPQVSVPSHTLKDSGNQLLLHFLSAKRLAKALEKQFGRVRAGSTNLGDPSRVYVRKAQYCWR